MNLHASLSQRRSSGQCGLSLIELMIGMTLGLVVLGALLYVFAGNRASYRHQESLSIVQENGRFALEMMSRDIRMAGYAGCGNMGFVEFRAGAFDNSNVIVGDPLTPDTLNLWRGIGGLTRVSADVVAGDTTIEVADASVFLRPVPFDIVITDCRNAETVQVTAVAANTLTVGAIQESYPFINPAQIADIEWVSYELVGTALERNGDEIVDRIEDITFLYGVDVTDDRNANEYVVDPNTMATPQDWSDVVSVRVTLTVEDGDVTLPFRTTVTLRNRAP